MDFWACPKTVMYRRKKTLCVTKSITRHLTEIRTAMVHNISGRIRNRGTGSQSGMFLYIIWKRKTKQLITAGFAHKSVGKQQSVKHVSYRTVRNHLSHIPVLLPLPIPHNNSIAYIFNDISGGLFLIYCSHAYVISILSWFFPHLYKWK